MEDLNVEFETLEEMEDYEAVKSARDAHVKTFMDKTGLPKAHAEQYASAVVKYPNNAMAGAEQAANRIAGPQVKVKFHQAPKDYQDKHIAHVKTMKSIMHGTNEEVEVEMETQIDEGIHSVKSMVEGILAGHLVESTETFSSILADKISERLAEAKIEVAQGIFAESSDDEDDEKSAETSDEDFSKHPLNQLQKIADYKPNTDKEDLEYTASGDVDKRSLRALEDRKKNKGSTSACPTFKHSNGEETNLEPEHAQHMVNVLKSSSIKPETKKSVFDAMHGSKAGFSKIQGALGTGVVKNKSIYGDDSRA